MSIWRVVSVVVSGFFLFFLVTGVLGAATPTLPNDAHINLLWRYDQENQNQILPHGIQDVGPVAITEDGEYVLLVSRSFLNRDADGLVLLNREGEKKWVLDPYRNRTLPNYDYAAMSDDGNYIAVIADGYDYLPFLFMLDGEGKVLWTASHDISEELRTTPMVDISNDGSFVAAVVNVHNMTSELPGKWVYLYTKNGQRLWKYALSKEIPVTGGEYKYAETTYNSVAISGDGKYIAAGTSLGHIILLDQQGNLLWEYQDQGHNAVMSIASSYDGSVFVAHPGFNVYFFNAKGLISKQSLSGGMGGWDNDVSVSQDGSKILVSESGFLDCFDKTGNLMWKQSIRKGYSPMITMSSDGSIIAASDVSTVHFLDSTGKIVWTSRSSGGMGAPKLSGNGKYLVLSDNSNPGAFVEYYSIDVTLPPQTQIPSGQSSGETGSMTGTRTPGFTFIVTIVGIFIGIFLIKNK